MLIPDPRRLPHSRKSLRHAACWIPPTGGWPRHGRAPVGAGEEQPAAGRKTIPWPASSATSSSRSLQNNPLFVSAALPLRVFPPLFNRYSGGHSFGNHVDNAIRQVPGAPLRIRTDLSATLFLSRARRIRWRRTAGRGHLRRPPREAARRTHGVVSIHQPASRSAGDPRRARRVILLDSEHDPRRCRADAAVRSRQRHSVDLPGCSGPSVVPCSSPPSTTTCCDGGPRCRRLRPSTVATGLEVLPVRTSPTSDRPACRSPAAASPSRRA